MLRDNSGFLVVNYGYLVCEVICSLYAFGFVGDLYRHVHIIMALSFTCW